MYFTSEKLLFLVLFSYLFHTYLLSQNLPLETNLFKQKRPLVHRQSTGDTTYTIEEIETTSTPPNTTFVSHTKKKRVKKREMEVEATDTISSPPGFGELESDRKSYVTKQGVSQIRNLENSKNGAIKISNILLTHPIPDVREEAARSLGRLKKGSSALQKAISQDSFTVRRQAFISLERIGGDNCLKYFIAGIKSSDPEIRIASYKGLGKTNSSYARELLINHGLGSGETSIVAAALTGLGNFSRPEDLPIFKKYLPSEVLDLQIGAIKGLGNSKANGTLELLTQAMNENVNLMPEIIFSISQKNNLHSTLLLFKIMQTTESENLKTMILRELNRRQAFGKYAIIKNPTASLKKDPRTNSERVAVLMEGDVARVKNTTEKLFKAKMNNEVFEDRYYLLEAINNKNNYNNPILSGWVFGPKLSFVTINKDAKSFPKGKRPDSMILVDEESEDEKNLPPSTYIDKKGDSKNGIQEKKKAPTNKDPQFDDEDE
jgi:hypothetical protein